MIWIVAAPAAILLTSAWAQEKPAVDHPGKWDAITDVPGVRVGNYTVRQDTTLRGVTATLFDGAGVCGLDVRGGNPVTSGDSTFNPTTVGEECDAVVFSGGSAFGLATLPGVVDYLFDHKMGVPRGTFVIPIVPAAVIYDVQLDSAKIRPTYDWGYAAAKEAASGPMLQGNVGAGAGGTTGKRRGGVPIKGGLGTASVVLSEGVTVGAMVILNAVGDVINPATNQLYATGGGFDRATSYQPGANRSDGNTTLVLIATDAELTKPQLTKIAQMAHDGLARAIRPIHTMGDGDAAYAVSVGIYTQRKKLTLTASQVVDRIGAAGADVLVRAIINGLQAAESIPRFPSYKEWLRTKGAGAK
jgi:L-aminopeptidase/D-esterase-like protein